VLASIFREHTEESRIQFKGEGKRKANGYKVSSSKGRNGKNEGGRGGSLCRGCRSWTLYNSDAKRITAAFRRRITDPYESLYR